jgi:hypothetical protein
MPYNQEVEDCLDRLVKLCSKENLPAMFAIQDSPNSFRTIATKEQLATTSNFKHMRMLMRSTDIDMFFRDVIREAQHNGHKSLFLRAMGIAEDPKI